MNLAYSFFRLFFKIVTTFFFRDIQVVGLQNIPKDKPVILVSNHANQFVDGMILVGASPYIMSFLIAAKSMRRAIIGHLARGIHAIPVERPQDLAKSGKGKIIKILGNKIIGKDTKFIQEVEKNFTIFVSDKKAEFLVLDVLSETELLTTEKENIDQIECNSNFKITPKIDQSKMYEAVFESLLEHKIVTVFPEGGSHDRTDLLPLKAGACIMALGCVAKHKQSVYIVPCGLNYFKGHRFRSKVNVEFGRPFEVTLELAEVYQMNKKEAIGKVLMEIEKNLRDVIVTAPSFMELQSIYMAKRLYKPDKIFLEPEKELMLNCKFSFAYKKLKENDEIKDAFIEIRRYTKVLKNLGIRDLELRRMRPSLFTNILSLLKSIGMMTLSAVIVIFKSLSKAFPGVIITYPGAKLITYLAEKERKKALSSSNVKIYGRDVVASYMIICSFAIVPIFTSLYTLAFFFGTGYHTSDMAKRIKLTIAFILLWPVYAYFMVRSSDGFFTHLRSIKSKLLFFFNTNNIMEIKRLRTELQKKIQNLVDKYHDQVMSETEKERILTYEQLSKAHSLSEDFTTVFDTLKDIGV